MTPPRPIWAPIRDVAKLCGLGINKARGLLSQWATETGPDGQPVVRTCAKGTAKTADGGTRVHTILYRVPDVDARMLKAAKRGEIL